MISACGENEEMKITMKKENSIINNGISNMISKWNEMTAMKRKWNEAYERK